MSIKEFYNKKEKYFKEEIWLEKKEGNGFWYFFFIKSIRILILSNKNFYKNRNHLTSSSLTFYLVLSIVPVVALAFGIAKGFNIDKYMHDQIVIAFAEHKEVMDWVLSFSDRLLNSTKGGAIAGVGIVLLFWSIAILMMNIEQSFNQIFSIKKGRSWKRKFTDYFSILLIMPILLIIAGSATVFITTQLKQLFLTIKLLTYFSPIIIFGIKLIPFIIVWFMFTFIYLLIPNTKINFKHAFIAGIFAGTAFQLVQWFYFTFQIGVSKYNAIYGSFAALPLFLIWVNISWRIVLYGAEICYSMGIDGSGVYNATKIEINAFNRKTCSLLVMHQIIQAFINKEEPLGIIELHHKLRIPNNVLNDVINNLMETRLIFKTHKGRYVPAQEINEYTVQHVIDKVENMDLKGLKLQANENVEKIARILEHFNKENADSHKNILLRDI